jgi:hypothetical protein
MKKTNIPFIPNIIISTFLFFCPTSMAGVFMSTATLHKLLGNPTSAPFVHGYIIGIKEAQSMFGTYCIPDTTPIHEIISTVTDGLASAPNSAYAESVQAGITITLFFAEKYPCRNGK